MSNSLTPRLVFWQCFFFCIVCMRVCVCVCGCPSNVGPKSEFFAPSVYINRLFIVFMGINQLYLLYLWVSISCQYCRIDYCYDFFGHDQTID